MSKDDILLQELMTIKGQLGENLAWQKSLHKDVSECQVEIKDLRNNEERRKGAMKIVWGALGALTAAISAHLTFSK